MNEPIRANKGDFPEPRPLQQKDRRTPFFTGSGGCGVLVPGLNDLSHWVFLVGYREAMGPESCFGADLVSGPISITEGLISIVLGLRAL